MSSEKEIQHYDKTPFEEALNKTGFGLYNFLQTLLTGLVIISFAWIAYGTTILVPASACELGTTTAQQGELAAAPFIAMAVSLTLTGGRIATFASIQILNVMLESNREISFYVFASIFASSAVIAAFLPDDRLLKKAPTSEEQQEASQAPAATKL